MEKKVDNQEVLKEILLRAKKEVFGLNIGSHTTPFKGEGIDFKEIKEYELGDDVRRINWKASAKSSDFSLKVNQFNDEKELNIIIAFMVSGSINFGSKLLKQDLMSEILAYIAYSASKNKDRFTTLFFSNKVEKLFKPTKKSQIIKEVVSWGLNLNSYKKEVDFSAFCDFINTLKQKSLIFIIGDFLQETDLSQISHKNEVYALITRDRLEEDIKSLSGEFDLIDASTLNKESFFIDASVAKEYKKSIKEHDLKLYEHFLDHGVKYGKIYTDEDVFTRLINILR
jgi:uncharacterized protein (DUF58 family)